MTLRVTFTNLTDHYRDHPGWLSAYVADLLDNGSRDFGDGGWTVETVVDDGEDDL